MVQSLKPTPLTSVQICLWKLSTAGGCFLNSEKEFQREFGLSQGITHPRALHLSFTFTAG